MRNVVTRPASAGEGLELIGHHEVLIPLLHASLAGHLAVPAPRVDGSEVPQARAA